MSEINIPSLIIDIEDTKNAKFYFQLKGKDLYMHVIQIFKSRFNKKIFNYKEISSFIRYDKSLRTKLLIKKDINEIDKNK